MSLLASIHGRTPFVFCTKKAAVPYEVGNCGFCVDVRYLGCGQVSTGPNGPMGAISDLAKSGLNTNRAYHIRICLDSCGFLHDERCLYVELINNVFCLARAGGERDGAQQRSSQPLSLQVLPILCFWMGQFIS